MTMIDEYEYRSKIASLRGRMQSVQSNIDDLKERIQIPLIDFALNPLKTSLVFQVIFLLMFIGVCILTGRVLPLPKQLMYFVTYMGFFCGAFYMFFHWLDTRPLIKRLQRAEDDKNKITDDLIEIESLYEAFLAKQA